MSGNSRNELFETMPIPRAMAKLCVPTILSSLVMIFYNIADTYFVGYLNDPVQNAAVALGAPLMLAFNCINNLFGIGGSSVMSRALGSGDEETQRRSTAFGVYGAVLMGLALSLLYLLFDDVFLKVLGTDASTVKRTGEYLLWTVGFGAAPAIFNVVMAYFVRAEGSAFHASIGTMSGCILNIILDPFFIMPWGLDMGAAGAGCATFISNCAAALYFIVYLRLRRGKCCVCLRPSVFTESFTVAGDVFSVGIPAAIQNLFNVTNLTVLNNFTAAFGSDAVAAMGIAHKIQQIPINASFGFSQGIMPIMGYNYSRNNRKRMREAFFFTAGAEAAILFSIGCVFVAFPQALMAAFIDNAAVIQMGASFLRLMGITLVFAGFEFLAVASFQACGMGRMSLVFTVLRKVVLELPLLVLLNHLFPLYGLPGAQLCAEIVLCIVAVFIMQRILSDKENNLSKQ
ncbi:MAG: MATE family efflux transporter [Oscillospiraceae bacterium]|nr:MATE family efflux transporter [Oscillospiraceae bacterium]